LKLGKKLRKNGVALDLLTLGTFEEEQVEKMQKFVETVNNNNDNSHF